MHGVEVEEEEEDEEEEEEEDDEDEERELGSHQEGEDAEGLQDEASYEVVVRFFSPKAHHNNSPPGAYCIKLLPEKKTGYFNQSFLPMVTSMVNSCLPEFSDFTSQSFFLR